jgi:DNA mismatch repair protein MutS2
MLGELQDTQRRLSGELADAARLKAEAERDAKEAAAIAERLRVAERDERKTVKKKLQQDLLNARAQVQGVIEGLKKEEKSLVKAKEAKQRLAGLEAQVQAQLTVGGETIPLDRLTVGDRVEVAGLGLVGTLLEEAKGKKRVKVRVGDREASVETAGLIGLVHAEGEVPSPGKGLAQRRVSLPGGSGGLETSSVVDLRGQAADEALDQIVAALDRAALAGEPFLRIIHGHGTGRLKAVLRDYLKNSPYVASFRAGERSEGGDGVTVVTLR